MSHADPQPSVKSLRGVDWLNFFLADVQTGIGPFLAASLVASGWHPERIGLVLTAGGLAGIALQAPAGAAVDSARSKRAIIALCVAAMVAAALTLTLSSRFAVVVTAQILLGAVTPFLAPAVTAITLGLVGKRCFDRRFGRNQSFNAAGNVFGAALMGWAGWQFGTRFVFLCVPVIALPTMLSLAAIRPQEIDYLRARGARTGEEPGRVSGLSFLFKDRTLLAFAACALLFHLSNAAMLPQLGELLSKGRPRQATLFMSACVGVTQVVIACTAAFVGRTANRRGRKPLLLLGFAVLPVRGVLYTLTSSLPLLISIQVLDGVANSIFGVVSTLVIADRTRGTGRLNLALGSFGIAVAVGAALSTTVAGSLAEHAGYRASFLGLAAIALAALLLLTFAVPETRPLEEEPAATQATSSQPANA